MKYVRFYATATDVLPVLRRLEEDQPIKYIEMGMKSEINRPIFLTCDEIPNPGVSTRACGNASTSYMLSSRDTKNTMYEFVDNDGQRRWLLSNGDNPDTVIFTMAGVWKAGVLLPGNMSTLHNTSAAQRIMKRFSVSIKAEGFIKYNVYWFGREALEMLRAGKRLVQDEQSPSSFDIPHPSNW